MKFRSLLPTLTLFSALALIGATAAQVPVPHGSPIPGPSPSAGPRLDARAVYQSSGTAIYQLKTAVSAEAPKASYGTGFVVSQANGILATNYHVIQSAVSKPEIYKLYVVMKEKIVEARILAFDVLHDLALITAKTELPAAPPLNSDVAALVRGEKLFSVGMPEDLDMSVVEGNFNGTIRHGFYEHHLLSSPINPGMSGGPTFNDRGEVVGVNVAILRRAQNISFLVPSTHLAKLLERGTAPDATAKGRVPASATPALAKKHWEGVIQEQLHEAQVNLADEWLNSTSRAQLAFKGWKVLAPPASLKCWRVKVEKKGEDSDTEIQKCGSMFSLNPDEEVRSGTYEVGYVNLIAKRAPTPSFFDSLNTAFGKMPLQELDVGDLVTGILVRGPRTTPACDSKTVVNHNGVPLRVAFCVSGYTRYGSLVDGVIKLITLEKRKEALLVTMRMSGFESSNFKKIIESLVESIAPDTGGA